MSWFPYTSLLFNFTIIHGIIIFLNCIVTEQSLTLMASAPPPNFSWVDPGKVAGLAMPRMTAHYQYLLNNGIKHLVSLSERKPPYHDTCPDLTLHHIKIHDFCAPTFDQINRFLSVVEEASAKGQVNHLSTFKCAMF